METNITSVNNSALGKFTTFLETHAIIYQFLRFGCIGLLNTALNFLITNTISKALNISQGVPLGIVAAISFAIAVVQSYVWNSTWTFGVSGGVTLAKNLVRLFLVGALGALAILLVLAGSRVDAAYWFYGGVLVVYLIFEGVLWRNFGFHLSDWNHESHSFWPFVIVTIIGLGINSGLVAVLSPYLHVTSTDLDKNIVMGIATVVSLAWNFVSYKIVVFKK